VDAVHHKSLEQGNLLVSWATLGISMVNASQDGMPCFSLQFLHLPEFYPGNKP
jgi:hypothetical protein